MLFARGAIVAWLLSSSLLIGLASANAQPSPEGREWVLQKLHETIRARDSLEIVRQKMLILFHSADLDGDGVSASDHELQDRIGAAQARSASIKEWLGRDLNGDAEVTRAELEAFFGQTARRPTWTRDQEVLTPTPEEIRQKLDQLVREALATDGDGNGVVSLAEMQAAADGQLAELRPLQRPVPLYLDRDGDGVVTETEFLQTVEAVLAAIDADGDGSISSEEGAAFAGVAADSWEGAEEVRQEEARYRKLVKDCALPQPPKDAKIILLRVSHGRALSTVSLGGDDETVTVVEVRVEPGDEPLYVLLNNSGPMIWRFFGAVDRVAYAVASAHGGGTPNRARVGVTGLPEDHVHIPAGIRCLTGFKTKLPEVPGRFEDPLLDHLIGRNADVAANFSRVSSIALPSAQFSRKPIYADTVSLPTRGASAPVWQAMLHFNPGGLVRIDAESVVSRLPARPYEVLPQQAGLAQLVEKGVLELVNGSNGFPALRAEFRIVKKMRFPAGLYGAHSVSFVIATGVPAPDGNPGHSRVNKQGGEN